MKALGLGEIVWDEIPQLEGAGSGEGTARDMILGGAVINVMAHLHKLGGEAHMLAAIGNDELGDETLAAVEATGVGTDLLRKVEAPSCVVKVEFGEGGEPSYILGDDVCWDHLEITPDEIDVIRGQRFDCLCVGTLSQRSAMSRKTVERVVEGGGFGEVCVDINLRSPFYSEAVIRYSLGKGDIAKMNREEASVIGEMVGLTGGEVGAFMMGLREMFSIDKVCVTEGEKGVHYCDDDGVGFAGGYRVTVADTVGAGDAFLAGLLFRLGEGDSLGQAGDFGCRMGALIASKKGAIADWEMDELVGLTKRQE